ncbi:MAG TPA: glycosyltransferase [Bacteroidia bacterium]|nr:glycosyltransferase [Bacteroidia bacterium]
MKISICIPTYNGEKYLNECLDSCINQSFRDFEVVIVDDGSTDATLAICKQFQAKDSRIKIHQNVSNLGLVNNWNKCLELASGEWIKFVFQDDYLTHDCLEKFVEVINEKSFLLVSKRSFILPTNASPKLRQYYLNEVRTLENTGIKSLDGYFTGEQISRLAVENICLNFIGEPSLSLFKKSLLNECGNFNADLAQICDLEFLQRIGSRFGLTYISKQLCHFRIHNESTTSQNLGKKGYQLSHIDPIILAHQMLYAKEYDRFRNSLNRLQLNKLSSYFKVRTYEAYKQAQLSVEHKEVFDAIAEKFVEIKKCIPAKLLTKCTYLLVQLKRRFAN